MRGTVEAEPTFEVFAEQGSTPTTDREEHPARKLARRWAPLALAIVMACLPIVTGAAVAVRAGWAPMIDEAAIQIHTLDVGTDRTPLVGMPSTLIKRTATQPPNNHPGPLQFWLAAPVMRVVSAGPGGVASLAVAQAVVNIVLVSAALVVLWQARRRPPDVLLGGAFIAAGLWIGGLDVAFSPWNPNAALVALLAACVAATACHLGRRGAALAVVALTFSMAAQAHLLYAVVAVVIAVAGAAPAVATTVRDRRVVRLVPAVVVLVLAWSGPLADIAVNEGGNLADTLARPESELPAVGASGAIDLLATHVLPWRAAFWQAPSSERLSAPTNAVDLAATAGIIAVLGFAAVRGRFAWFARTTLAAIALLTTMTAVSPSTRGVLMGIYQQRVWIPVTLGVWIVLVGWATERLAGSADRRASLETLWRRAVPVAVVAALLAGVAPIVRGPSSVIVSPYCNTGIRTLAAALPELDGREVVLETVGVPVWTLNFHSQVVLGLYAELVRRGADARLTADGGWPSIPGELGDRLILLDEPWPDDPQVITVVGRDQPAPASGELLAVVTGENCIVAGDRLEVRLYG